MASCVCVLGLPDTDSDNVETPGDAKRQGRLFLRMRKETFCSPLSSLVLLSSSTCFCQPRETEEEFAEQRYRK